MSQDYLGLFDTPPTRPQIRLGLVIAGLFTAFLLILPFRDVQLPEFDGFVPMNDAIVISSEVIAAVMLYAQAAALRSRALTVLGAGNVFAALLLIPHTLTFPGAFSLNGLLGAGINTTAWIVLFRQIAFPVSLLLYIRLKQADSAAQPGTRASPRIALGVGVAVALAVAVTLLTTLGHGLLPPFFVNRAQGHHSYMAAYESVILALYIVATGVLFRKRTSALDMWLLVTFWGSLIAVTLVTTLHGRFTVGWYGLYVLIMFANLVVPLALMTEGYRLYARLTLATSARNRERDARLESLDALAAAISHETGQSLTAIRTHARAGLNRLTGPGPDVGKVMDSLHAIIEAGHGATDAIKSLRPTVVIGSGGAAQFNLNDLVRATAYPLERELAGADISLELALDEALPPILADRAKLQRVLVNLLANAIESLEATDGRTRRIAIRTRVLDDHDVLIGVSDNGVGITAEHMPRIFDALFTTKAAGAGLGLSLCRTIVETHGGRLWVSPGEAHGATFHIWLPGVKEAVAHREA
jgi:signal transduction histidine kinase